MANESEQLYRADKKQSRVVVTGMGALTPLGLTTKDSWEAVLANKNGITPITRFDTSDHPVKIAGEVKDFVVDNFISKKEQRKMDRFIQLSLAATEMAMADAQLEITDELSPRAGTIIGVGMGGLPQIESQHTKFLEKGPEKMSPFFIPMVIANLASGHVSMKYKTRSINYCITSACSSGNHAIGEAMNYIRNGHTDVMIAGGAEAVITGLGIAGFSMMRALSRNNENPEEASRPFDKDRDGFVLSEGAATLILESYEHARNRGAKIYAEISGYGFSSDCYHISSPPEDGQGAVASIKNALEDARLKPENIDYVNAHGTSTPVGDSIECMAIKNVFQDHQPLLSSTKGATGHLLGAAGAVESLFSILTIKDQIAPHTRNLKNIDEGCGDVSHILNEPHKGEFNHVLNNSFGFGGTNSSLIFSKI